MTAGRPLTGKVAIVTGASAGIGAAGARRLAQAGATVVLAARRADRLAALAGRLNQQGAGRAIVAPTDVTREADRTALVDQARQLTGQVDILVNNAGFGYPGAVEDLPPKDLRANFETNFFAAVGLMQLLIPPMRERRSGRVVNMSSVNGRLATPGLGAYAASKFALEAVSDAARMELSPFGVHVALIEPGTIKTEIWGVGRGLGDHLLDETSPYYPLYQALLRFTDLAEQRGADPDVVARAILHAAAAPRPKARYVLPLDGRIAVALSYLPAAVRDPIIRRVMSIAGRQRPTTAGQPAGIG